MPHAPTLSDEGIREDRLAILFSERGAVGDPFVIHFYWGIFVGRMPYAPTLTDEWIPEDRSAIPFS